MVWAKQGMYTGVWKRSAAFTILAALSDTRGGGPNVVGSFHSSTAASKTAQMFSAKTNRNYRLDFVHYAELIFF